MNEDQVQNARAWKKTHENFPLTPHPNGQWAKKVLGKTWYFGKLEDPQAALRQWLEEKDYLLAGLKPPAYCCDGTTIGDIIINHLNDVDDRIASGVLSWFTRRQYVSAGSLLRSAGLAALPANGTTPVHWTALASALEHSDRSLRTRRNIIMATKAIMNWGKLMGMCGEIQYGPRFNAPTQKAVLSAGVTARFLDREIILYAINQAKDSLRLAILLGINCAFQPSDSIMITRKAFDLDVPCHDFPRVKTGQRRRAILWPETVAAINSAPNGSDTTPILLRSDGQIYTMKSGARSLAASFSKLLDGLNRAPGVNLGSLRHTWATIADQVPDQSAIDLVMGHTPQGLQKRVYRQHIMNELERLRRLSDTVRQWLFYGK